MFADEAGVDMQNALAENELTIETARATVPATEFDHCAVGYREGCAMLKLSHYGNKRQQFDVGRDLMGLGPDDTIVVWCGDQGIELSMLWSPSNVELDVSPDDAARFEAELYFADATPI